MAFGGSKSEIQMRILFVGFLLIYMITTIPGCNCNESVMRPPTPEVLDGGDLPIAMRDIFPSIINLIATPEVYNGRYINIIGYVFITPRFASENCYVFLSQVDFLNKITPNGIKIILPNKPSSIIEGYKFLNGTFLYDQISKDSYFKVESMHDIIVKQEDTAHPRGDNGEDLVPPPKPQTVVPNTNAISPK